MREAIIAYQLQHFLSVVRTLMPEVERFGRMVLLEDGTMPKSQRQAVEAIKAYLGSIPVTHFDPLESFSIYQFLERDLFATCCTVDDAKWLGPLPNRHAELHGLMSYGDLRGATVMLSLLDFLLHAVMAGERNLDNDD